MGLPLLFTLLGVNVNVVSSNVYIVGYQFYSFKVVKQLSCSNVVVPRMQGTFDDFAVYLAGSKRAVLMAAERLNCIVFAVCIEKRNSCAINIKLLAAVLFNLAPLGDLDKCQLSGGCNQSGYKLVIGQQQHSHQYTLLRHI